MDELNLRPPNANLSIGGEEKTVFTIFPSITKDISDIKISFQGLQIKLLYPLPAYFFMLALFALKLCWVEYCTIIKGRGRVRDGGVTIVYRMFHTILLFSKG